MCLTNLAMGMCFAHLMPFLKDVQAFERTAKTIGMPLKVVEDIRGGGREKYGAVLILIRPDQFVARTSDGGSVDADEVLSRVIGRPVR